MWWTCLGIRSLFLPGVADSLCYRLHCEDVLKIIAGFPEVRIHSRSEPS